MEIGFGEGPVSNGIEGPVLGEVCPERSQKVEGRQRPGLSRLLPSSLARRCPLAGIAQQIDCMDG